MKPPYKIPTGWSKGEPLMVTKKGETCFQLTRSGGYLDVPGMKFVQGSVPFLEFSSRVEMVMFQQWWDNPSAPDVDGPEHRSISPSEYLEFNQEIHRLRFSDIWPGMRDIYLHVHLPEKQAKALQNLHHEYCLDIEHILYPERFNPNGERIDDE